MALEDRDLAVDQRAGRRELGHVGDHRQHDPELAPMRGPEQRPDLGAEQRRPVERHADGAPADRRVLLLAHAEVGQHLVAADIERAEHHRPVAGGVEDRLVEAGLLLEPREGRRDHELQLGAEQADAVGARLIEMRQVEQQAGIDVRATPARRRA